MLMRPGSCLSLLGFHRSKCWMWTTTTVQQCLWALDWQNEREREGGGGRGERERFMPATVWSWMVLRVQRQQLHSAIILVHGFERFEAFLHIMPPPQSFLCMSHRCTEVVDLLLARALSSSPLPRINRHGTSESLTDFITWYTAC